MSGRTADAALREQVARAIYDDQDGFTGGVEWDDISGEYHRDWRSMYESMADAAIGVVRASLTAEITAMPIPSGNGAAVLYERQGAVNFRLGVLRIVRGDTTTNGGDQ